MADIKLDWQAYGEGIGSHFKALDVVVVIESIEGGGYEVEYVTGTVEHPVHTEGTEHMSLKMAKLAAVAQLQEWMEEELAEHGVEQGRPNDLVAGDDGDSE